MIWYQLILWNVDGLVEVVKESDTISDLMSKAEKFKIEVYESDFYLTIEEFVPHKSMENYPIALKTNKFQITTNPLVIRPHTDTYF